jgi:hypothetical protein
MKNYFLPLAYLIVLLVSSVALTSCEVIGDIFGAGVYTGMFIVIFIIVLVIFLVVRMTRKK